MRSGNQSTGIYLFGSVVVGVFKSDSDIDILVAVNDSLTFPQRKALVGKLIKMADIRRPIRESLPSLLAETRGDERTSAVKVYEVIPALKESPAR